MQKKIYTLMLVALMILGIGVNRDAIAATMLKVDGGGTGSNLTNAFGWLFLSGNVTVASSSPTVNYITATSTSATSTFAFGIQANLLNITSATASSTFANGINLTKGCFAISNVCLGSGSESVLTFTWPLIRTTNTITFGGLSTSSPIAAGANVLYSTGVNTVASAATGTVSGSSQVSVTSGRYVIGGSLAIDIVADSIGDAQLAFNTGQNLTTASSPTFAGLTLSSPLTVANGGTNKSSYPINSIITSDSAGTSLIATGTQLTVGNILATTTATSTYTGGIQTNLLRVTSTIASSTFSNGINLTAGCFSINNTCVGGSGSGSVTNIATGYGLHGGPITTTGTLTANIGATFTVSTSSATGDFTDVQSAIDNLPSTGGLIHITCGTFTLPSGNVGIQPKVSKTIIEGSGQCTQLNFDKANTTNAYEPQVSNLTGLVLRDVYIHQTNATFGGIGINASNTPLFIAERIKIDQTATSTSIKDTKNLSFYQTYRNLDLRDNNSCIDIGGNPVNDNSFYDVRCALQAGNGGFALYMDSSSANGAQNNTFVNFNSEPNGAATGLTGIYANSAVDNTFIAPYVEGNAIGYNFGSNSQRNTIHGGEFITNTTYINTGTSNQFLGVDRESKALNQIMASSSVQDVSGTDAAIPSMAFYGNTNFAKVADVLQLFLSNSSDTGTALHIKNPGTGPSIYVESGKSGFGTSTPSYLATIFSSTLPQFSLSAGAGIAQWAFRNAGGDFFLSTSTVAGTATTSTAALSIAGGGFGTTTLRGLSIIGQATSTTNVGFNLTGGCYAINNTCLSASGGGLSSYDAWTHPAAGISATTSEIDMAGFVSTASSTIVGNATTTGSHSSTYFQGTGANSTSTFAGGLAVETTGLVYDFSSNLVGIGTAAPIRSLTIGSGTGVQSSGTNGIALTGSAPVFVLRDSGVSNGEFNLGWNSSTLQLNLVNNLSPQILALTAGGVPRFVVDGLTLNTGIGTSTFATAAGRLTIASTTQPQISLMGGVTDDKWNIRSIGNTLSFATSSPTSVATSSRSALSIDTNGFLTIPANAGVGCAQFDANGKITNIGSACGSGGGLSSYDAWTHPASLQSATTSQINMAGFLSTASSTIVGNATTTGSHSASYFRATGAAATSTFANALAITAGQQTGSSNWGTTEGTVNINNSSSNYMGLQVTSSVGSAQSAPLVLLTPTNTAFDNSVIYVDNSSTDAASTDLLMKHAGYPAMVLWDTTADNANGAGKYQFDVHNNLFRILGRDGSNGSFNPFMVGGRAEATSTEACSYGRIGFYTGFGCGTARIEAIGTSTLSSFFALTSVTGATSGNILQVLQNGNVGIGSSSPYTRLGVAGTIVADAINATSTTATSTIALDLTIGRYLRVGPSTLYPWDTRYGADFVGSNNGFFALNVQNKSTGTCASADLTTANDGSLDLFTGYTDLGISGSKYTSVGCSATDIPMSALSYGSTYLFNPNGPQMMFALGTTSPSAYYTFSMGGYARNNIFFQMNGNGSASFGTTTGSSTPPVFTLTAASSTKAQLALSAGAGVFQWVFRALTDGTFAMATTTTAGTATSSVSAFLINANGFPLFPSMSAASGNNCVQVDTTGKLSSTGSVCGAGGGLSSYDAWTHLFFGGATVPSYSATTSQMVFGTSTASTYQVTLASTTAPQLSFSAGSGFSQYFMRAVGGNFYFGTTTVAGTATSTNPILSIIPGGVSAYIGLGSSTPFAAFSLAASSSIAVAETSLGTTTSMTVDWRNGNSQRIRIGTSATTITFSSFIEGMTLKLIVCNPGSTAGAITWGTTVLWPGGTAPTQTTTANKCDVWSFLATNATSSASVRVFGTQSANF